LVFLSPDLVFWPQDIFPSPGYFSSKQSKGHNQFPFFGALDFDDSLAVCMGYGRRCPGWPCFFPGFQRYSLFALASPCATCLLALKFSPETPCPPLTSPFVLFKLRHPRRPEVPSKADSGRLNFAWSLRPRELSPQTSPYKMEENHFN